MNSRPFAAITNAIATEPATSQRAAETIAGSRKTPPATPAATAIASARDTVMRAHACKPRHTANLACLAETGFRLLKKLRRSTRANIEEVADPSWLLLRAFVVTSSWPSWLPLPFASVLLAARASGREASALAPSPAAPRRRNAVWNLSFATLNAASGSMPSFRATLTSANSRSPNSSSASGDLPPPCGHRLAQLANLFLDLVDHIIGRHPVEADHRGAAC